MSSDFTGDLHTLLHKAAFAVRADRSFLSITGPDATRWLNGMVTNSVQSLQPREGNYNFLLNAQGRIQGDCTIYRAPGDSAAASFVLETSTDQIDAIHQLLDRFIIMDDVELELLDRYQYGLHLIGPSAPAILADISKLFGGSVADTSPLRMDYLRFSPVLVTTPSPGLVPRFYLGSDTSVDFIADDARRHGAVEATPELLEALRILEARPRYGTDIRNNETARDLPQETNQTHALHFAKGCYLGQEIVERIRSRGQVHRQFTAFHLNGAQPASLPAPLERDGKVVGELTSAASVDISAGVSWLALGYARREALETGSAFLYAGGTATVRAAGSL